MPLPPYPLINGNRYDFSSVIITVGTTPIYGVKSITYKDELKPGEIRGTSAQVIGRTRGKYSPSASIELYKSEADSLIATLSPGQDLGSTGYMEVPFFVAVAYNEPSTPSLIINDSLVGCRIMSAEDNGKEGEEPVSVKFDLHVMLIKRNGRLPIAPSKAVL